MLTNDTVMRGLQVRCRVCNEYGPILWEACTWFTACTCVVCVLTPPCGFVQDPRVTEGLLRAASSPRDPTDPEVLRVFETVMGYATQPATATAGSGAESCTAGESDGDIAELLEEYEDNVEGDTCAMDDEGDVSDEL